MSMRDLLLPQVYAEVQRQLTLRKPQRDSLGRVHEWLSSLPQPLSEMPSADRMLLWREAFPGTPEADKFPTGVFALATGVGKTRLMAALISYLFLAEESQNFLVLIPRQTILRQFLSQLDAGQTSYLFKSEGFVPQPRVWHAGNLDKFALPHQELNLSLGPNIFCFSPQSFTGGERRATRPSSDFADESVFNYLQRMSDLVVLVDEAHHLPTVKASEARAWSQLVRDLEPVVQFGLTATPAEGDRARILHEYPLQQCLAEGLYTKSVRILTEQRPKDAVITDEDWDRRTLDFALGRLQTKEAAVLSAQERAVAFPNVQPVLLIAAESTSHADAIAAWLNVERNLNSEALLVTHSDKAKSEADLERLAALDKPGSKVRVVINVMELSEGWDVTNVYVVAPLRAMATFVTAIQTMGRGLRLPAGRRVGIPELDTLDVICFGRDKFEDILESALKEFSDADGSASVEVQPRALTDADVVSTESVLVTLDAVMAVALSIPNVVLRLPEWNLTQFDLAAVLVRERDVVGFDLRRLERFSVRADLTLSSAAFARRTAQLVIKRLNFLSGSTCDIIALESAALALTRPDAAGRVKTDPLFAAELLSAQIQDAYRRLDRTYEPSGTSSIRLGTCVARVPSDRAKFMSPPTVWSRDKHARRPLGPWKKCTHAAVILDSGPELQLAGILDSSAAVVWWARNDPPQLKIATAAGGYWPDFFAQVRMDEQLIIALIGVKGEHLWDPSETSDSRLKASGASNFAAAATLAGSPMEHWLLLGGDIEGCKSVEDLRSSVVSRGSFKVCQ